MYIRGGRAWEMSAIQHTLIIGSHVAYLPGIFVALSRAHKDPLFLVDLAFLLRVTIISLVYHASDAGLDPFGDSSILQPIDNLTVWDTLLWVFISSLRAGLAGSFAIWWLVSMLFVIFPRLLIDTFVFQLTFLPAAILVQLACIFVFQMPPSKYNWTSLVIGILIFAGGLPFLYFRPYYTLHGFWHFTSGIGGAFFVYCGLRNVSLRSLVPSKLKI